MIYTSDYTLVRQGDSHIFRVHSYSSPVCPGCGHMLSSMGSRLRRVLRRDGSVLCLRLRRLRCPSCGKIHHELPDFVVPYKRYEAEVIEGVLITLADTVKEQAASADYPCEQSTARRLHGWFLSLLRQTEKQSQQILKIRKILNVPKLSLPYIIGCSAGWLRRLIPVMYNP